MKKTETERENERRIERLERQVAKLEKKPLVYSDSPSPYDTNVTEWRRRHGLQRQRRETAW